jgi:hypothetical protein
MLGQHLTSAGHQDRDSGGAGGVDNDLDLLAERPVRDRVAGAAEPDAGKLVDLAQLPAPDAQARRRQRPQQAELDLGRALLGDGGDLGMGGALTSSHHGLAASFAPAIPATAVTCLLRTPSETIGSALKKPTSASTIPFDSGSLVWQKSGRTGRGWQTAHRPVRRDHHVGDHRPSDTATT